MDGCVIGKPNNISALFYLGQIETEIKYGMTACKDELGPSYKSTRFKGVIFADSSGNLCKFLGIISEDSRVFFLCRFLQ